jgi:hypothetical protein
MSTKEMIMNTVTQSAGTVQMHHTLFADAVKQVSELAQAKLPESLHGRVQRATALVLHGAVWLEDDGSTCVVQCSNGRNWYPVNGHCVCPDAHKAPDGYCKHRVRRESGK